MMLYGLQNVFIHHYNSSILMEVLRHFRYNLTVRFGLMVLVTESQYITRKDVLESPFQNLVRKSAS